MLRHFFRHDDGGVVLCPWCGGEVYARAGKNSAGHQRYRCKTDVCGRSFVVDPGVPQGVRILADRMFDEGLSAGVIARVLSGGCSRSWVYARQSQRLAGGAA